MKKIILFLTIVLSICFNLIYFKYFSFHKENAILYKNNTELSILYNANTPVKNNLIDTLKTKSKKLKINISQYVYLDDTTLNIYSSNIGCDNNINLIQGNLPRENSNEYISNIEFNDKNGNAGKIQFPKSDFKIRCYNLDQLKNVGVGNKFIISTKNKESVAEIIELFKEYGKVQILPSPYEPSIGFNIRFIPASLISVLVSAFLLVVSVICYIIKRKSRISLEKLFGYNLISILSNTLTPIILIFFIGEIITSTVFTLHFYFVDKCSYIFEFYCKSNVYLLVFGITLLLFSILLIIFINKNINILHILKGQKITEKLNRVVLISKVVISLIVCFLVGLLFNQYNTLQKKLLNVSYWNQTENIYKTCISNQGQDYSLALDREYNNRLYSLYKNLKVHKNAFIIDATNYSVLEENGDNITYLHDVNAQSGNPEYSPYRKSIVIDEGYLNINPIKTSDNTSIHTRLNSKDNVLNVLVPEKYKDVENDLHNSYLDDFYFAKIKVDNIYNKELKLPLNNTKKEDLNINIIYVKNNQKYFTYSDFRGSGKDHHYITDPVCIIYDGKVDNSFLAAYASHSLYFFDNSKGYAYENISRYLKDSETNMVVRQVESVYKDVNEALNDLKVRTKNLLFTLIMLVAIAVVFSITYIRLYYENNSYKLYLKTIMGYNFINIHLNIICVILVVNMTSSLLASIFFKNILVMIWGTLFTILEFIIAMLSTSYLNRQNINKIIKGEK